MTKLEQATERALVLAQAEWLRARGWRDTSEPTASRIESLAGRRWRHYVAPTDAHPVTMADAVTLTRGEPLRYRGKP